MTTITPLPAAPNPLTDSQSGYNSKALAFAQALPTLATEINTVAGEVNTAASDATTSAGTATTQAGIATTQAGIATDKAAEAAASADAAALYQASMPAGSINDSLTDSTHTYSSQKIASGAMTMSNKTLEAVSLTNGYTEEVFALTGTTPNISAANGSIQTWALTGDSAPTSSLSSGQSVTLEITPSTYTITAGPSVTWLKSGGGGAAPSLYTAGKTIVVLWKIESTLYGSHAGDA